MPHIQNITEEGSEDQSVPQRWAKYFHSNPFVKLITINNTIVIENQIEYPKNVFQNLRISKRRNNSIKFGKPNGITTRITLISIKLLEISGKVWQNAELLNFSGKFWALISRSRTTLKTKDNLIK